MKLENVVIKECIVVDTGAYINKEGNTIKTADIKVGRDFFPGCKISNDLVLEPLKKYNLVCTVGASNFQGNYSQYLMVHSISK